MLLDYAVSYLGVLREFSNYLRQALIHFTDVPEYLISR